MKILRLVSVIKIKTNLVGKIKSDKNQIFNKGIYIFDRIQEAANNPTINQSP